MLCNIDELCQIAFFLNIEVDELCHPVLPEKSQTERFNERVAELNAQGKGMYRTAREVGCCPSCALRANRKRNKAPHRYDVRKGMKERNWKELDKEALPKVKELATEIYSGNGGRPGKVTVTKIFGLLNEPVENSNMFPLCLEEINKYSETYEEYWARECVWAYKHLAELGRPITWSRMSKLLNLNKDNFLKCIPMLERYADEEMASIIGGLI